MKREAFKMFLKPGFEKEYEKRHAAIWPELKKKKCCPMEEYMITPFIGTRRRIFCLLVRKLKERVFARYGANPIVQKWWDYMADIMEVNPDNSPVTIPLPEVFHMD